MKKLLLGALAVSAVAITAYGVHAQSEGTVVGNPDSANVIILEEGYETIAPVVQPSDSNNPNYDNSAAKANMNNNQNSNANPQPASAPSANGANLGNVTIDETVDAVTDGNGNGAYEVDETVTSD